MLLVAIFTNVRHRKQDQKICFFSKECVARKKYSCIFLFFFFLFFLCLICVWSLFCSVRVYISPHSLPILLVKLSFRLSVFWNRRDIPSLIDSSGIGNHNHLVCKRRLNHSAKKTRWLSLRTKWLWVWISLLSQFFS